MTTERDNLTICGGELTEETFPHGERQLSTLLGNLPGIAYRCQNDKSLTMEFVSAGCFELTGYHPEDLINSKQLSYADLIDKEDRQRVWTVIQAALPNKRPFRLTYRINTAAGEQKWVWEQGVGIFAPDGSVEAFEGFITDITERKKVEKQLRDSQERFRRIFEDGPLGMTMAGDDFCFIGANQAFCRMMGYSEQELMSLTFKDITHPEHLAADVECANRLFNDQIPIYRTEKRYIRKNGDTLWASVTVSTIRDAKGDFLYFLSMIEDITERKRAEMELKRLNAELMEHDRIKNKFVSTVSHELRTPLCVFKNVVSNALAGVTGPMNAKLRKNLEMANQNIDRLSRIINDFLDVAKIEAGKMQVAVAQVNIGAVIREVIEAFAPIALTKNISIDTVISDKDIVIECDRDKLVQILTNLVGNAAKFVCGGGHILVTLSDHNDEVSVSVHDDGPGIEPKYLDKIFDRFQLGATSTGSGQPSTGLGLTISKELVEMHHGRIWAESIFGRGSTFTFVLPKKQPQ